MVHIQDVPHNGQVAQLVEQGIENPRVGGSIPSLATISPCGEPSCRSSRKTAGFFASGTTLVRFMGFLGAMLLGGCGTDSCERLCVEVGQRLDTCFDEWPTDWGEVDAATRAEFRRTCQDDWSAVRSELEPRELDDGLDQCSDTSQALNRMGRSRTTCDQLRALYLGES